MTLVHIVPLFLLGGIALRAMNDYAEKKKSGRANETFKTADIGLDNTELWK